MKRQASGVTSSSAVSILFLRRRPKPAELLAQWGALDYSFSDRGFEDLRQCHFFTPMFDNLRDSIDHHTSRFERNVVRFARKNRKRLQDWDQHDYRAGAGAILAAAIVTLLEWIALPITKLGRLFKRR